MSPYTYIITQIYKKVVMAIGNENEILESLQKEAKSLMADWPSSRNMQKRFVLAYIANGFTNASEAARKAGYSEKSTNSKANQLLSGVDKYKHIKAVVDDMKERFDDLSAKLSIADSIEVLQYLTSVMRGKETEPMLVNIGDYRQDLQEAPLSAKDRLKAAELLGKRYSLWTDKIDANIETPNIIFNIPKDDING
jgi:phage terminase small subunit